MSVNWPKNTVKRQHHLRQEKNVQYNAVSLATCMKTQTMTIDRQLLKFFECAPFNMGGF